MMHKSAYLLLACLITGPLPAQQEIPLLRPEEQQAADGQRDEFYRALAPVLASAAKSTVRVWAGKHRLAYGTVIADGRKILTKFSEVGNNAAALRVEAGDGSLRPVAIDGVYQDEDITVLSVKGEPLTPVKWFTGEPKLGGFLTATQPGGQPAAFGVVSVLQRNLRETDKAYLGVQGDPRHEGPGVKLKEVTPQSGAAAAGLRQGDVILRVKERPVSGMLELRNALTGLAPGSRLPMTVRRGEALLSVEVLVGNRPDQPQHGGERLRQMEQMGGPTSRVRDSFSNVIQSDMCLTPDQIGGPVVDLQGRVVGITMARADRTRSFVMPAAAVIKLLESQATDPAMLKVATRDLPGTRRDTPPGQQPPMAPEMAPRDPERMRRHLADMQHLQDFLRMELERPKLRNR
jgi:S1-C subfamily serine protease